MGTPTRFSGRGKIRQLIGRQPAVGVIGDGATSGDEADRSAGAELRAFDRDRRGRQPGCRPPPAANLEDCGAAFAATWKRADTGRYLRENSMTDTNPLKPSFGMTDEARGHSERFRAMTRDTLTMLIQHAEQLRDHGVLEALHDALNRIKAEGRR